MTDYECRAVQRSEHGFLISRGLGEFRRARVSDPVVKLRGSSFLKAMLARPDAKGAVIVARDVIVAGAIGVSGGVVMLYVPEPFRCPEVYRDLLTAVGVLYEPGRTIPWLVPPPWWAQKKLVTQYDPFRLHVKGDWNAALSADK